MFGKDPVSIRASGCTLLLAASFLGFTFLTPSQSLAQIVQGQLLEKESGNPVDGALVVLVREGGEEVDGYLTNAAGRFRLRVGTPGRFTVRAERIGYETVISPPFDLTTHQTSLVLLETSLSPIALAELRIEGEQQCVIRPTEGLELARLWQEARKVLRVQEWTARERLYEYLVSTYVRELDKDARVVQSEDRRPNARVAGIPFRSLPAEDLMEHGFMRQLEDGTHQYFAPNASVLLSDLFLDTHCFKLTLRDGLPSSIGLFFEPVRRGEVPDITGTLWLDRASAELQFLEYGYTSLPYPQAEDAAGGRIEFEGLPNGAWIVKRWWIRMPTVSPYNAPGTWAISEYRVSGVREAGGEVRQTYSLDRPLLAEAPMGLLSGVVWDSIGNQPLEGASVFLSGTSHHSLTDSAGRFLMDDLREGVFKAAFSHPLLDSLGVYPPGVEVEITLDEATDVRLSIPSSETILAASCRVEEENAGTSALVGTVRSSEAEHPVPGATVAVWWTVGEEPDPPVPESAQTTTDVEGRYVLCGLPSNRSLDVRASFLEYEGSTIRVQAEADSHRVMDLELGLPPHILSFRTSAAGLDAAGGTQGIQGRILEPGTDEPVRMAEVVLRQTPGRIVLAGVTNERGFFRIASPQPGTFTFYATALGYAEVQADSVGIAPGRFTVLEVEMAPAPLGLDPLVVVAGSRVFRLEVHGFYDRAEQGFGHYITPEDIEARPPSNMGDLFGRLPGIQYGRSMFETRMLMKRPGVPVPLWTGGDVGMCEPMLYVDGFQAFPPRLKNDPSARGLLIADFVHLADITAVEVYTRASSIPLRYGGSRGDCGVVLIWTKGS